MKNVSLYVMATLFFVSSSCKAQVELTADNIISEIKENLTVEWSPETVDTYKGGSSEMKVTGIATTFLATLDVLQKVKAKRLNMIITHEPTFYNHVDNTNEYGENDAIVSAKQQYIKDNGLIVFRFHDYIHRTSPDGIFKGIVNKLGWAGYEQNQRPYIYKLPALTVAQLGSQLKEIFNTPTIRIVGNPDLKITKVGLVLGASGAKSQIRSLQRDDVEVIIIGETHEWETVEYVRDAATLGKKKALIIIGHANSEEAGMEYCAEWLKTFITEVPIEFVPAGDPFWTPQ